MQKIEVYGVDNGPAANADVWVGVIGGHRVECRREGNAFVTRRLPDEQQEQAESEQGR